jgi:hypothetical protein
MQELEVQGDQSDQSEECKNEEKGKERSANVRGMRGDKDKGKGGQVYKQCKIFKS